MLKTVACVGASIALAGFFANRLYFKGGVCTSKKTIEGKVVIVTGSNCGIGYETALDLARRGGTIVMACRNLKRANQAATRIRAETKNQGVFVEQLDLADLASIRSFAERFKSKFGRLDILINNAGILTLKHTLTKDSFESQFGIHHLGHFYLTNLLLDLLKTSAPSRLVVLASESHEGVKMDFDNLNSEKDFLSWRAYCRSKLANVLFALEFSNRFGDTGITAVSVEPGFVRSEMFREVREGWTWKSILVTLAIPIFYIFTKSSKEGAQTTLHCALDDDVPEYNGQYFV